MIINDIKIDAKIALKDAKFDAKIDFFICKKWCKFGHKFLDRILIVVRTKNEISRLPKALRH